MPGIFACKFANNFECPVQVWSASRMPSSPHDHGDARVQSLANHDAEIAFGAFARTSRLSGAQVIRSRIGGTGVATDEVRALLHGTDESFLSKTRTEIACGR